MKSIKVNVDYEIALFEKKEAPKVINQAIEFLVLYLEDRPLYSAKNYSKEFLDHVRKISGREPVIKKNGEWENWWGDMKDVPLEERLNSKEFILPFSPDSQLLTSAQEVILDPEKNYLAKSPFGMSGQNFLSFSSYEVDKLKQFLTRCGRLIVEPKYKRVHDFSHYVFPDGSQITYENLVDQNFQYKGTIFSNHELPNEKHLSFYEEISPKEWSKFKETLAQIQSAVRKTGGTGGFSVDSFTYLEDGELKIKAISEVNYRKTMGLLAYLLSIKYFKNRPWTLFVLGKSLGRADAFNYVEENLRSLSDCFHLSPGDTRFEVFLLGANSEEEGLLKYEELRRLLPGCQFTVKI